MEKQKNGRLKGFYDAYSLGKYIWAVVTDFWDISVCQNEAILRKLIRRCQSCALLRQRS